jgi:hypothetical protein
MIPFFFLMMGHSNKITNRFDDMMPVIFINMMIGFIVGMQIKVQYANPRARLLPGFNMAHLIVPAIIITAAMLLDVWIADVHGVPYFTLAGYALFLIAAASWNAYNIRGGYNFLFVGFLFASIFMPKYFVVPILTGGILVSVSVFCIGLFALAALGLRVVMLCEEMPEYTKVVPGSKWDIMSRGARSDWGKIEAQMIARSRVKAWLQDFMFLLVFRNKTALNPPRRFLLRQLSTGFPGVFVGIILFISIPVFLRFTYLLSMSTKEAPVTSFFMMMLWYVGITLLFSNNSGSWLRRWQYLIRESLFPISRTDFARELVRNGMFDAAAIAVGFLSGTIVGLAASQPERLLSGSTPLYIATIISQIFMVGSATLCLVSYRSIVDYIFGCLGIAILSLVLIFSFIFGNWLLSSVSIVATAAGIVGFYRLAFRRWCEIDLD